jgi:hypothetical protein
VAESLSAWLALRERADAAARSVALTAAVTDRVKGQAPVTVLDLGTGTGANVRYLAPLLGAGQHWLVVDRDSRVLSELPARMAVWAKASGVAIEGEDRNLTLTGGDWACRVELCHQDLVKIDRALLRGRRLVTASALLDLVSDAWLHDLAEGCRDDGTLALFALTYDGRARCSPADPADSLIVELLNRHQRQYDTGFGTAAGPDASDRAAARFAAVGYRISREPSDWRLSADMRDMQRELFSGWASAALEIAPGHRAAIRAWFSRRVAYVEQEQSRVVIGHQDVAAWP